MCPKNSSHGGQRWRSTVSACLASASLIVGDRSGTHEWNACRDLLRCIRSYHLQHTCNHKGSAHECSRASPRLQRTCYHADANRADRRSFASSVVKIEPKEWLSRHASCVTFAVLVLKRDCKQPVNFSHEFKQSPYGHCTTMSWRVDFQHTPSNRQPLAPLGKEVPKAPLPSNPVEDLGRGDGITESLPESLQLLESLSFQVLLPDACLFWTLSGLHTTWAHPSDFQYLRKLS